MNVDEAAQYGRYSTNMVKILYIVTCITLSLSDRETERLTKRKTKSKKPFMFIVFLH